MGKKILFIGIFKLGAFCEMVMVDSSEDRFFFFLRAQYCKWERILRERMILFWNTILIYAHLRKHIDQQYFRGTQRAKPQWVLKHIYMLKPLCIYTFNYNFLADYNAEQSFIRFYRVVLGISILQPYRVNIFRLDSGYLSLVSLKWIQTALTHHVFQEFHFKFSYNQLLKQ